MLIFHSLCDTINVVSATDDLYMTLSLIFLRMGGKMKKYTTVIFCVIVFFSCIGSILVSCSPNTNTEESVTETRDHAYTLHRLESFDPSYEWNITGISDPMQFYRDGILYLQNVDTLTNTLYDLRFSLDGSLVSSSKRQDFSDTFKEVNAAYLEENGIDGGTPHVLSDGKYLVSAVVKGKPQEIFFLTDSLGNILTQSAPIVHGGLEQTLGTVTIYRRNSRIICVDDDCFVYYDMYGNSEFFVLDGNLQIYGPYPAPSPIRGGYRDTDGSVILTCDSGDALRYQSTYDHVSDAALLSPTDTFNRAYDILYGRNTTYLVCGDGIYIQKDGVEELLCDWEHSYLDPECIFVLDLLPDDVFLIWYRDPMLEENYPALLTPLPPEERTTRKTVSLASIFCTSEETVFLRNAIYAFNRENETYRIDWHPYDIRTMEKNEIGHTVSMKTETEVFEADLLGEAAFDLLLFGSDGDASTYLQMLGDKQLLFDLSALSDEIGLLEPICEAYALRGTIHALPLSVRLTALLTTRTILSDAADFTYQTLASMIETSSSGTVLFSRDNTDALRAITQFDFIDYQNKNCNFTDKEYLTFLDLLDRMENKSDTALIAVHHGFLQADSHILRMAAEPLSALSKENLMFANLQIDSIRTLPLYLYLCDRYDGDFVLSGFPSRHGGSLLMEENLQAALYKKGKNPDGADAVLRFLFSDTLQTCKPLTASGVPVTQAAWENCISDGYYYIRESVAAEYDADLGAYPALLLETTAFSENPLEYEALQRLGDVQVWTFTKEARQTLLSEITNIRMCQSGDLVIMGIIEEELLQAENGVRTREAAAEIIQSRVWIYLNE